VSYYPAFLNLEAAPVLVVGGGEVARGKIEGLLASGAQVRVVAREADPPVRALAGRGAIELQVRAYEPADVGSARLVVAATGDSALNQAVSDDARKAGVLVNVVDAPALSTFIAPAVLERGDLRIAVSTGGASPAFAVFVRDELARRIGPEYGAALGVLRRVRERLRAEPGSSIADRKRILRALADGGLVERLRARDRAAVDELLRAVAGDGITLEALGVDGDLG
jgi:siroheme synthase-like protein